jgi:hypothetical protein
MSKYFKQSEFDSKDDPGSGKFMDPALIEILDIIREECNFPFIVNSGVRTKVHNVEEGGKENSDHLVKYDGYAHGVDIRAITGVQKFKIISSALRNGIVRIGVGSTFVHLGNWIGNPQEVLWTY